MEDIDIYSPTFPLLERSVFYTSEQEATESIDDYLLRLKSLATTCEFGQYYNEAVRDRFVMGLNDKETRNMLLRLKNPTLEQAKDIAIARAAVAERNSSSNGGPSNLAPSADNGLISNRTSMPGSSQDAYVAENLSNGNTHGYHSTSNPQPLTQENVNQPNQVSLNINDANSPAQLPIHDHTSMPGTSQVVDILIQNSPKRSNTHDRLTTASNPQASSFSPQHAPSTSYNEHMYGPNAERSPLNDASLISPVKSSDGKTIYPCPYCEKTFANHSWCKAHTRKHSSEKNYLCRFCQKRLKNPGSLKNHEDMCKMKPVNIKKENTQG